MDDQKAWTYFGRAAALGNHCGMYKIGDMYYHGRYVGQDFKKAVYWYRKAISLIDEDCPEYPNIAARLGHCALKGEGMEKDVLCALKWLQAAESAVTSFCSRGMLSRIFPFRVLKRIWQRHALCLRPPSPERVRWCSIPDMESRCLVLFRQQLLFKKS